MIGIVGGGQLARMLTEAALPLGFKVTVLNPTPGSPAAQAGADEIVGDLYDPKALKRLADKSDYLTVEIEHLDTDILQKLAETGKPVNPAPGTIKLIQDKLAQKRFMRENGLPVADFTEITNRESAEKALADFGGKMLIKTRHGAYDGRGNMVVDNKTSIGQALEQFKGRPLYAEKFIPFTKELAVIAARGQDGQTEAYDAVETFHERNICVEVLAPAPIDKDSAAEARQLALNAVGHLEGSGVFGIEMFLTKDAGILINEIAPRVHNSGHHTIEACRTSQFEQHVRAITGMPLSPTDMKVPAAAMVNILGERDGPVELKGLDEASAEPHTKVHIYGKSPTKIDRKMGHITATGQTVEEARRRAETARQVLSI